LEAPIQFTDDHADITDEPHGILQRGSGILGAPWRRWLV